MARTDTLGNFLTDVADAIRDKKGTTGLILASDFDTEIESISTGGSDPKTLEEMQTVINNIFHLPMNEPLSDTTVTLYTPNIEYKRYGVVKTTLGYRAVWTKSNFYRDGFGNMYAGYIGVNLDSGRGYIYVDKNITLSYVRDSINLYYGDDCSTIEDTINYLKSNTSSYSQASPIGFGRVDIIIPVSNTTGYDNYTKAILPTPNRIAKTEIIEVIQ